MGQPSPTSHDLNDDDWWLVRLFRCLDSKNESQTLQRLARRLLRHVPIAPGLRFAKHPNEAVQQELAEDLDERLQRIMPFDRRFTDLYDYDYPLLEAAWPEGIAETLLSSSKNDEDAAENLVRAYLEGANECDEPLPTDYRDDCDNPETFEQEIMDDLKQEACVLFDHGGNSF